MVNLLHNITSLAGVATLCKILDFQNHLINLSGGNPGGNGNPIISFPETPGASNENWFIVPQTAPGTFTIESFSQRSFFVSYAAATIGLPAHSGALASNTVPTVFRMETVGNGPAVNLVEVSTNFALTAWNNPDPATRSDPTTPLTVEGFMNPKSFMQSFTIQLRISTICNSVGRL
ncbi:hypothetical protein C8R43DRAFT_1197231 [Mycena crocata]|nr:hypothetical protein C8R43DRAFT_1197231 [Mycena crocata]